MERSERMLRGQNVRFNQKRGRMVGKTKFGKGTRIIGIADTHSLPLALRAESENRTALYSALQLQGTTPRDWLCDTTIALQISMVCCILAQQSSS